MKRRPLDKLRSQIDEMEQNIDSFEALNPSVSAAPIGWHIEHNLLILNAVIHSLNTSDPTKYRRKINFVKMYFFARGKFPRGKVRAPKAVRPQGNYDHASLSEHLTNVRENAASLEQLDPNANAKHPIFGVLRLSESIYFLELHTKHHLKIIREIKVAH